MKNRTGRFARALTFAVAAWSVFGFGPPPVAHAGCGCSKPPPPPAAIRPNVAYRGAPLTFFSAALALGQTYVATFTSSVDGTTGSVGGEVVLRRDLADGVYKPQLVVPVPDLPLGPARISVAGATAGGVVLSIPDTAFTVAPDLIDVPSAYGEFQWNDYQAATGRDGVSYVSLDLTKLNSPMVFEAQALGYPLRFESADVVFYNVQGFLMQRLMMTGATPVPGMFVFPAADPSADGDVLHYSRHEFTTYFLQHMERQPHALDPTDPNWHVDGTPHVDHNHLILAIIGTVNGAAPAPGPTPPFTLATGTYSLFHQGLVGIGSLTLSGTGVVDSYTPGSNVPGSAAAVFTNGKLSMSGQSAIRGDATAKSFAVGSGAVITGSRGVVAAPASFMAVKLPTLLPNLGAINFSSGVQTLVGPGSFQVSNLTLQGNATLFVDNAAGPVTLYVTGNVKLGTTARIQVADPNPEKFAVYLTGNGSVSLSGSSMFYGVLYAPNSDVTIGGEGDFSGAFVGGKMAVSKKSSVHYDSALRGKKK